LIFQHLFSPKKTLQVYWVKGYHEPRRDGQISRLSQQIFPEHQNKEATETSSCEMKSCLVIISQAGEITAVIMAAKMPIFAITYSQLFPRPFASAPTFT